MYYLEIALHRYEHNNALAESISLYFDVCESILCAIVKEHSVIVSKIFWKASTLELDCHFQSRYLYSKTMHISWFFICHKYKQTCYYKVKIMMHIAYVTFARNVRLWLFIEMFKSMTSSNVVCMSAVRRYFQHNASWNTSHASGRYVYTYLWRLYG